MPTTDEAKPKIASGSLTKKKKNICFGLQKEEQCCLFWKKKENVADSLFAPKTHLFVYFQKQNGKPCQYILLPKTVNHDFSCP